MKVVDQLVASVRNAALYNPEVQIAPACILWTDSERLWEQVVPRLQAEMPELLVLGDFHPGQRQGPAIWLRCIVAGQISDLELPENQIPVIYLPGVSRQDLRAVETCPEWLKPIAELQYRGVIWSQINAKDWTILAFLKTDQGGLNLHVAQDQETKTAAGLALSRVLDEDPELLKTKRLDRDYFNSLLTGGDPVKDLLVWIDQENIFRSARNENEWKAFSELISSQFNFDPRSDGVLAAAAKLAEREGPWLAVWERFSEAPKRYPNIGTQIRRCQPPDNTIFWHSGTAEAYGGWIQWNEEQEKLLRSELLALQSLTANQARLKINALEDQHRARRGLVWAELGEAPLAKALEHLGKLAEFAGKSLAAGTITEIAEAYLENGWRADAAMLKSFAEIDKQADLEAVKIAARAVYLPWIEDSARYLQQLVDEGSYPGGTIATSAAPDYKNGECVLFVDGLRLDAAKRLSQILAASGLTISEKAKWAALPSVTATGKTAISPVRSKITGLDNNADFEPSVAETGQSLKGGYHLKKLLKTAQWKILEKADNGDGQGLAWCEFGDIDHEGHDRGWKLAKHLEALLIEISKRIASLISAGWKQVHVVTDHGWLLLPGGLPKIELSSALTSSKWGRCAALKAGAVSNERLYPWFWNPGVYFALANGVSCFKAGEEYAHGGLSLQECLTLELYVTAGSRQSGIAASAKLTDIGWRGMRCTVAGEGAFDQLLVDVRSQPGDPASSLAVSAKNFNENGVASVVIEDSDLEGQPAFIVITDKMGNLISQTNTVIGGE